MGKFEILCVTMGQHDFSRIRDMNIHSDVLFTNQADTTSKAELEFEGKHARMVTTDTRGVGCNRNLALLYARGEICLMADDDVVYNDNMERQVLAEFEAHPDADVMIFHFDTDSPQRKQKKYAATRKCGPLEPMPWAGFRIAFRLEAVRKANLWFTTLFGGGCIFPSGEDSLWLIDARRAGLRIYVSKETIGRVSFETSTWFTGVDERFYYGKGAFYQASHPKLFWLWACYFVLRTRGRGALSVRNKFSWIRSGREGYRQMLSYDDYTARMRHSADD